MDFELSDSQAELRDAARKFARGELREVAAQCEKMDVPPPRDLVRQYAELGFLGISVSQRFGGLGLSDTEALLVIEQFAQISSAVAWPVFEACVGPVRTIERFGTDALRQRVVPAVCSGEKVIAAALSEAEAGSALSDLRTRGTERRQTIIINGTKRWCSGGGHADGYLVFCRLSDEPGAAGIGAIYVSSGAKGLSTGARENLMGFRGIPSADLHFDDVEVPRENLVMPAGSFGKLMETFALERCGNAMMALAQASSALEDALAYVQEREQFGRPLVDFQGVQLKLADMAMKVEAARLLIFKAAANTNAASAAVYDCSVAKCFSNQIAREVTGDAIQLLGAYGYSKSFDVERRFRDAWGWGIAGGTIEIQKINIASALVGRRFNQRTS